MKKLLVVLLALCMVLCFAACTNTPAESSAPADESAPAESTPADESKPADESVLENDSSEEPAPAESSEDAPAESSEEPAPAESSEDAPAEPSEDEPAESSEAPAENSKDDDDDKYEWTLFRVTAIDNVEGKTEGACMIFTEEDTCNAWCQHIAFVPNGNNTWKVTEISASSGDNKGIAVPEGGFVYVANLGNDWPSLISQNNVKGDGATGLWYDDETHLSLPNYANAASQAAWAIAQSFKVGDVVAFKGIDPLCADVPTSTPDKDYWDNDYVCTSYFRIVK